MDLRIYYLYVLTKYIRIPWKCKKKVHTVFQYYNITVFNILNIYINLFAYYNSSSFNSYILYLLICIIMMTYILNHSNLKNQCNSNYIYS